MARSAAHIFANLSRWLFLGVIVLLPLLVTPWTVDMFETPKQALFMLGVTWSAASFMVAMLVERRFLSRPGLVMFVPIIFLAASAFSATQSLAPMTSWIGQGAQEYTSVLSLVGFVLLFFLATAFLRRPNGHRDLLMALFIGSAVASSAFIPALFGWTTGTFTNLVGTPHAFGLYLLMMSTLACGLWLTGAKLEALWMERVLRACSIITFVTCVAVLLMLNSTVLWALTLTGMGGLFVLAFLHADKFQDPVRFMPSMLLFIVAFIGLVLPVRIVSPFLQEVAPNLETTWNVVQGAWNEGSVAWGTGPGTFSLLYPKYTSLEINKSIFWDLVFDRGNAYLTTQLAAIGLIGVLTWIFFTVLIGALASRKLVTAESGWKDLFPWFAAWFVLVVASGVYTQNFTLAALFWLLSAVLANALAPAVEVQFHNHARARLVTAMVTVIVLVCTVATVFITIPRYLAEVAFAKAVTLSVATQSADEIDEVIRLLDKAAGYNPWNDSYYRNLSSALLRRLSLLTSDEAADSEYVQSLIATILNVSEQATRLSPSNVMNWDARGLMYRELLPVVPEAAQPSIDAYERAIQLAPTNPRYRVEVARAYLAIADSQNPLLQNEDRDVATQAANEKSRAMDQAEEQLMTAVSLKADYAPAHYYLSLLRERQGNLAEAVRGLEIVRAQAPEDVGVGLQLGLLYLRQGKNDLAQAELQRVIGLVPTYADAHWYLSVVFEQKNDLPSAILEVEKVLEANPDNVTVKTRLDRLKAGQVSETIPDPISLSTP